MDDNGIYVGTVIYDSDLADTANKRPLNRVKVLIEGKSICICSSTYNVSWNEC